jgi:hypothetical protein
MRGLGLIAAAAGVVGLGAGCSTWRAPDQPAHADGCWQISGNGAVAVQSPTTGECDEPVARVLTQQADGGSFSLPSGVAVRHGRLQCQFAFGGGWNIYVVGSSDATARNLCAFEQRVTQLPPLGQSP